MRFILSFEKDPLCTSPSSHGCTFKDDEDLVNNLSSSESVLVKAKIGIKELISSLTDESECIEKFDAFEEGGRTGRTTLAHLFSLAISDSCPHVSYKSTAKEDPTEKESNSICFAIEPLYFMRRWKKLQQLWSNRIALHNGNGGNLKKPNLDMKRSLRKPSSLSPPYIMERTDIWCDETTLNITLAVMHDSKPDNKRFNSIEKLKDFISKFLEEVSIKVLKEKCFLAEIANVVLQNKLRSLLPSMNAVAFIANGSILPRQSGASFAPMSSPPAIPSTAPESSNLKKQISIRMGKLAKYVKNPNISRSCNNDDEFTVVGMVVPKGITLIVGGGYHGKSTMLRAIMSGVYNKILGDGRELCVTDIGAVTVRAEDGRYVNNTNVSAFISNLPITGSDTKHFSTREASGSTSQASNVVDAIEMGASALLVDEDVSAANFMSRDGRMVCHSSRIVWYSSYLYNISSSAPFISK